MEQDGERPLGDRVAGLGLVLSDRLGTEFKVLGINRLDELCLATPAVAGGKLLVRTASRLYCIAR